MNRLPFGCVLAITLFLLPSISLGEWHEPTGPLGIVRRSLAIDPVDSSSVFLGNKMLFHSNDGGRTYRAVEAIPMQYSGVFSIAISRDKDGPIIINEEFFSYDRGKTWVESASLGKICREIRGRKEIRASVPGSRTFYLFSLGRPGLGRSKDNGKSWEICKGTDGIKLSVSLVIADRFDPNTVSLVGPKDRKDCLLLSRDGGQSFRTVAVPEERRGVVSFSTDPGDKSLCYICVTDARWRRGGDREFFYSYDEGKTWELYWDTTSGDEMPEAIDAKLKTVFPDVQRSPFPEWPDYFAPSEAAFSEDGSGLFIGIWSGRVYRSEDFGKTWEISMDGLVGTEIRRVVPDPKDPDAAYCADLRYVWRTADHGKTWEKIMPLNDYWFVRTIRFSPEGQNVFVTAGSIWKGTADGKDWERKWKTENLDEIPEGIFFTVAQRDDKEALKGITVVAGEFLVESTDGGDSWEEGNNHNLDLECRSWPPTFYQVGHGENQVWYAQNETNHIMKSTDRGGTWEKVKVGGEGGIAAYAIGADDVLWAVDRNSLHILGKELETVDLDKFKSDLGIIHPASIACTPDNPNTAFIGFRNGQVLRTVDRGKTFEMLEGGPRSVRISCLAVSQADGALWVGTEGNGVWILGNPKTHPGAPVKARPN